MTPNSQPNRDTVYVDVDDEITSIIDKVRASDGRIVALVLPKRASVLQSVVNMKLLKRSAEQAKKQLVLITTEAGLLPLAGSVGVHVAETLQSKPVIPKAPLTSTAGRMEEESLSLEDEPAEEFTAENAGDQPVGELAGKAGTGLVITSGVDTETPLPAAAPAAATAPAKRNKKLQVPNFNKFRLRLVLICLGVIALLVLAYLALMVLPKATIAISTNAEDVNSSLGFSLDTTASSLDVAKANVPGTAVQQQKTYTQQVDATGKLNNGKKASGTVTMSATRCFPNIGPPDDVPAGTGITTNQLTFITQDKGKFHYNGNDGSSCNYYVTGDVSMIAQNGGTAYNVSNADFTVTSGIKATGSASGGTDDITQVVSQADIDNAKKQIKTEDAAIKQALYQQLSQDGQFPIRATFQASDPTVSSSSQPGDKASTVTVTESITYTMFGTKRDNLVALIKDDIGQQVDLDKQSILSDGLDKASFTVSDISDTVARIDLENTATVGPKIDKAAIAQQVAGMKSGKAKDTINQLPGVTGVEVKLSPFWVSSIPKNADKIVITVGKTAASN